MKITIAKNIGFCGGVAKAVKLAESTAEKYGSVQMFGDIVHNEIVVNRLNDFGIKIVQKINNINENTPVLLRAHGTPEQFENELRKKNLNIIDATCPLVHEIHDIAKELESERRQVIIIGDHGHDEVVGIESRLSEAIVISTIDDARNLNYYKRVGIVVQSTQFIEDVTKIVGVISGKTEDLRFVNTICNPTRKRQEQIKELSSTNEVVLIVGSFTSANTKRLTKIATQINQKTYQIESEENLKMEWFKSVKSVGIAAGASTPKSVIYRVEKRLREIYK